MLFGHNLCLNTSANASYTVRAKVLGYQGLWPKMSTTYGPVLALSSSPAMKEKTRSPSCLSLLIAFGKN